MEFKFRATDDRPPTTATMSLPSQTLGSCFMAGQEMMLGRSVRFSSEPTGKPTGNHVQATFQREVEKELIRQEIIAAETARRTELVGEVMREMAMEREMAMQRGAEMGMSLEEWPKMWINYKQSAYEWRLALPDPPLRLTPPSYNVFTSPMPMPMPQPQPQMRMQLIKQVPEAAAGAKATPVVESNKDKLIVLDRPDHNGAKCKAEAPPAACVGAQFLLGQKTKLKEEWSCALCKVAATCERSLREHLQGRKHKKMESALRVKQMSKISTKVQGKKKKPSSEQLTCLEQVDGAISIETEARCKRKSEFKFWCEICGVGAFSKSVMRKHKLGKKHKARTQVQSNHPDTALTSKSVGKAPPVIPPTATVCDAITVPPSDPVTKMVIHDVVLQEEKVKDANLEDASSGGQAADKAVVMGVESAIECMKKRKFKFWCEICNIGTHSKGVMESHMLGRKHNNRVEIQFQISAREGKKGDQTAEAGKLEDVAMEELKGE